MGLHRLPDAGARGLIAVKHSSCSTCRLAELAALRSPRSSPSAPRSFLLSRPPPLASSRSSLEASLLASVVFVASQCGVAACPWVSFLLSRRGGLGRVASLHLPHALWEAAFRRFARSCAPYLAHARTSRAVLRACSHFSVRLCSVPCAVSGPFRSRLVGSSLVTHAPSVQHFEGGSRGGRW